MSEFGYNEASYLESDKRPSAKYLGVGCCSALIIIMIVLALLDIPTVISHVKHKSALGQYFANSAD